MGRLLVVLLSGLVVACVVRLNFGEIESGDQLEITQPLTIAANDARVYLQYGRVVDYSTVKRFYPHCWFISWRRLENAQQIQPGVFQITRVVQKSEFVSMRTGSYKLAMLAFEGGVSVIEYITEFNIESLEQPDIRRLICGHWEDAADPEHLSAQQIQQAMGDYAKIIYKAELVQGQK